MERCQGEIDAAHRSRSGRGLVCPQDVPFQLAFPCPVPGSALGSTPSACDGRVGGGGGLGWVGLTVTLSTSVSRGGAAVTARGQLGLYQGATCSKQAPTCHPGKGEMGSRGWLRGPLPDPSLIRGQAFGAPA